MTVRPFGLTATNATLLRSVEETATKTNSGRWSLYDGGEMVTVIPGISEPDPANKGKFKPVLAIVDLATFKALDENVVVLQDHDEKLRCGTWSQIDMKGHIEASLELAEPSGPNSLNHVREIRDLLAVNTPLQASIDAAPSADGKWERMDAGATFSVNGRQFVADATIPTYVLRNGEMHEASIVTFGACLTTGRIAAASAYSVTSTPTPKDDHMTEKAAITSERITTLLATFKDEKQHPRIMRLLAAGKTDPEIKAEMDGDEGAEMAAKCADLEKNLKIEKANHDATKAASVAQAAAWEAEKTKLTAKSFSEGEAAGRLKAKAESGAQQGVTFVALKEGEVPTTLTQAMHAMSLEKDQTLKGSALREAALRKYPNVERR